MENISRMLKAWPQAVSADDGDLRVLHDLANAGAQDWRESLCWPDYLWLGLENKLFDSDGVQTTKHGLVVPDPTGNGPHADLGVVNWTDCPIPTGGTYAISNQVECFVEIKAIKADTATKIKNYRPKMPWPNFLTMKLDHAFMGHLKHANDQIRDGKRIVGFPDARGIVILINEGSPSLNKDVACAYLARAIGKLKFIDGVVYLSDSLRLPNLIPIIVKSPHDIAVSKFHSEFLMMLSATLWENNKPIIRTPSSKELLARIEMGPESKKMYAAWSTGWRVSDDPTPVPSPSFTISFVPHSEYSSGLK